MSAAALIRRSVLSPLVLGTELIGRTSRRREGLMPPTTRVAFLKDVPSNCPTLELGPFDAPLMRGPQVRYFDVLDQEGLRRRAVQEGRDPSGCPVIDHVSPTGDLSIVDATFDVIFSSHVIEHQHDLIGHLLDVATLLQPGGAYYLIVPDKRFCFDHFAPASQIEEALAAADDCPAAQVERAIEHVHTDLTHNNALKHWLGIHGNPPLRSEEALNADIALYRRGVYRDIHAFKFTPGSFLRILTALYRSGRSPLAVERVHATRFAELEFYAVLRKLR